MKLTLIRHSRTKQDPAIKPTQWALSEEGVTLAQELSDKQVIKEIDVLYASLQTKALETAVLLGKHHGIPIKTNDDLTEVKSFTVRQFGKELYEQYAKAMYLGEMERIEDNESLREALERFSNAINFIVASEKDKTNIGIVSHANVLSLFAEKHSDKKAYDLHNALKMPDVAIIDWDQKQFITMWGEDYD